jgi:hypothetical protein
MKSKEQIMIMYNMNLNLQEDKTGTFFIIYEVVTTHQYEGDDTIFRAVSKNVAEEFIQKKTDHVLKQKELHDNSQNIIDEISFKVEDHFNINKGSYKERKYYFDNILKGLSTEKKSNYYAEYYSDDFINSLKIKEKKVYVNFNKYSLFSPCINDLLKDEPDKDKILELMSLQD